MGCLLGFTCYFFSWKIISLLKEKRLDPDFFVPGINEVDIYQFDPSELPGLSETKSDDQVWYFFCEPNYMYAKSKRVNRATGGGYWKLTGKHCNVRDRAGKVVGGKKTLVFYRHGLTSKKIVKTDWVMREFYVQDTDNRNFKKDFVACCIAKKTNNESNVSTPDDGQPSYSLSSASESHVTENPSTEVESQLPASDTLDSNMRYHFPESTSPMVDPQLLAKFGAINVCDQVNQSSFSAIQSPINPNHGSNSSYSNGINNDCNVLGYQSGSEEDVHSRRDFCNDFPRQMTALSDSDIEAFINEQSMDMPQIAYVNLN